MIAGEVRNSDKIVADLLDFARSRPPQVERIEAAQLIDQVLAKHDPPPQVEVTTQCADDLPPLLVDPQQIGMVLGNLVTNAYQAMSYGGTLTIAARRDSKGVAISVTDTGYGISPEHMDQLFEPLFTTKARGVGLGLAICKKLVEGHGGSIQVTSQPGEGSTFTIVLPAAPRCTVADPALQEVE